FPRAGNVHFQQLLVRLRAEDVQRTADLLRGQLEFAAPVAGTVFEDRVATADGLDMFCDDRFGRKRPGGSYGFGPRLRRLHRQARRSAASMPWRCDFGCTATGPRPSMSPRSLRPSACIGLKAA